MAGTAEGRRQGRAIAAQTGQRTVGGSTSVRFFPDALRELLESPGGPVAKDLLKRVIRVEGAAKRACPVDTGRLRASITHSLEQDGRGLVGFVGTDVQYAIYVELGTRFMRPQPYLRPALRAAR